MTEYSKKDNIKLAKIPCIYILLYFKKNKICALINSGSKVNATIFANAV